MAAQFVAWHPVFVGTAVDQEPVCTLQLLQLQLVDWLTVSFAVQCDLVAAGGGHDVDMG